MQECAKLLAQGFVYEEIQLLIAQDKDECEMTEEEKAAARKSKTVLSVSSISMLMQVLCYYALYILNC